MDALGPVAVYPDPPPEEIRLALLELNVRYKAVSDIHQLASAPWSGAIVCAGEYAEEGLGFCRALRRLDPPVEPILLITNTQVLAVANLQGDLFDSYCLDPQEFKDRIGELWNSKVPKENA